MRQSATPSRILRHYGPILEQLTVSAPHTEGNGVSNAPVHKARNILVTSADRHEGRTTSVVGLAIAAAMSQPHQKILLVDFDLRNPQIAEMMCVKNGKGAAEVLSGAATVEEVAQPTKMKNLFVVTAGTLQANLPDVFLNQTDLSAFLKGFDVAFYDSPPANLFPEASILSRMVDTTALVVRAGRSMPQAVLDAKTAVNGTLAGAIFSDFKNPIPSLLQKVL